MSTETNNVARLIAAAVIFITAACSHNPNNVSSVQVMEDTSKLRDGTSAETAVVLEAKSQSEGIAAQRVWIDKNLPGARLAPLPSTRTDDGDEIVSFAQEVLPHGDKLYSVVHLVMPDGKLRDVYFDISGYFGK